MNHPSMQLSDLYIEPDFKIHRRNLPKGNYTQDRDGFVTLPYHGEHLHDYIEKQFLFGQNGFDKVKIPATASRLLLLLGQPGQGKTSLCYRTIYDLSHHWEADKELILLKLNRLKDPRQFLKTPFDELSNHFENYQFEFEKGLLILDGLDELYMAEGLTKAEITDFFSVLSKEVKKRTELTVLVTSRFHYVDLSKIGQKEALRLSLAPLTLTQQQNWLEKYLNPNFGNECQLTAETLVQIHAQKEGQLKALWELVNQPILLQLVAKADFDIQQLNNRGKIYEDLFDTLIQRSWDKQDGQLKKFCMEEDGGESFRRFLRALAHRIYQSDKEFITLEALESWEGETPDFIENNLQSDFKNNIGEALKDVLITFYFKPVEEDEQLDRRDEAIEFYHKSLQEYLAMEHIWHTMLEELTAEKKKNRFFINDWRAALKLTWQLSTPKKLSQETGSYLRDIIENHPNKQEKETLLQRMTGFFPDLLEHQFLYKYDATTQKGQPMAQACSCFYVYWTILSILPKETSIITEQLMPTFCELLTVHQKVQPNQLILFSANLIRANLSSANLRSADLRSADLSSANLRSANLRSANLRSADLNDAKVGIKDWLEKLEAWEVIGYREIVANYQVNPKPRKDLVGSIYYVIEAKE